MTEEMRELRKESNDALAARHDRAVRLAGSWHRVAMKAAEVPRV